MLVGSLEGMLAFEVEPIIREYRRDVFLEKVTKHLVKSM